MEIEDEEVNGLGLSANHEEFVAMEVPCFATNDSNDDALIDQVVVARRGNCLDDDDSDEDENSLEVLRLFSLQAGYEDSPRGPLDISTEPLFRAAIQRPKQKTLDAFFQ